jgi:signal transduction histidine kinase
VVRPNPQPASPTTVLLLGLIVTLAAVALDAWYVGRQISRLQSLQTDLTDRNRRDSLQLLRIQNDLNSLGLAMRDMLDSDQPYPLTAWTAQFDRIRLDLTDAMRQEEQVAVPSRTPEQRQYVADSVSQFWDAVERMFALARNGQEDEARAQIRLSLQARQAALNTAVARLLVQNNEAEEETAQRIQTIYGDVQRQLYLFVAGTAVVVLLTSVYVIRTNRRLFARLASLSDERRELAQQLIAARESTLSEISRELHDELGQVLTAIGSLVGRAVRQVPVGSPLQADLREVREIAQTTLENVRGWSQTLHPSALEQAGLEATVEWYVASVRRQSGLEIVYECTGPVRPVEPAVGIHVYRVLQEALSNVTRHSGASRVGVRLRFTAASLEIEVEDNGRGIETEAPRRGLGIVGMRERAAIVGGTLTFAREPHGTGSTGTIVRLRVPLPTLPVSAHAS